LISYAFKQWYLSQAGFMSFAFIVNCFDDYKILVYCGNLWNELVSVNCLCM